MASNPAVFWYALASVLLAGLLSVVGLAVMSVSEEKPLESMGTRCEPIHDFTDGLIIGALYLVSVRRIATTIAITIHEFPHEMGANGGPAYRIEGAVPLHAMLPFAASQGQTSSRS